LESFYFYNTVASIIKRLTVEYSLKILQFMGDFVLIYSWMTVTN